MAFTESVRSFQVPDTPGTAAWPPSLPSVPTSRATRVTSEVNSASWSTMPLKTSAISSISTSSTRGRRVLKSPSRTALSPSSSCWRRSSAMRRVCAFSPSTINALPRMRPGRRIYWCAARSGRCDRLAPLLLHSADGSGP